MDERAMLEWERRQGITKRREFWRIFRQDVIEVLAVIVLVGGLLLILNWGG